MSGRIPRKLRQVVRARAGERCEYCHMPEVYSELRHVIDHVVAQQHHGPTVGQNLALSCGLCNGYKGPNLSGVDPQSGKVTPLFDPRTQTWREHFRWSGIMLVGVTDIGRATADVLAMNIPERLQARIALLESGEFPRDFQ